MPYILLYLLEYCLSTPLEDKFHEARDLCREILAPCEQAWHIIVIGNMADKGREKFALEIRFNFV